MTALSSLCCRPATEWQEDDHRLVVAHNPDTNLLEALPFCPGVTSPRRLWCQIPRSEGGLLRVGSTGCALDALWEDPLEWVSADVDLSTLACGVWAVRWRICPAREVPVWQPWVQIDAGQVAA